METKDIAALFVTAMGKIEFYWHFYTVTLLALIGWLVSTNKSLGLRLKLLITVGYLAFAAMNITGLISSYSFAEALRKDLQCSVDAQAALPRNDLLPSAQATAEVLCPHPSPSARAAFDSLTNTRQALATVSFARQKQAVFVIHALVGACVLLAVWLGSFFETSSPGDSQRHK